MEMALTQVQEALKLCNYAPGTVDGQDGPETQAAVRRAQEGYGIEADGIAGPVTTEHLSEQVRGIQAQLNAKGYGCPVDGLPGPLTDAAVKALQVDFGLVADGIVGYNTEAALFGYATADQAPAFDPNEQVTEHFNMQEFICECGGKYCDGFPVPMNRTLIEKLECVRKELGIPLVVTSGVRCDILNEEVGGVPDSYHKLGRAADIAVYAANGYTVDEVADAGERYGLKTIRYYDKSFVHFQWND